MNDNPIAKKLDAITKILFTLINSLGIIFITIMIDAIINPSYYAGFIAITLGIMAISPILGVVFYGLIDSCLCRLEHKERIEWLYKFFVEILQTIIQFGVVGLGLFLINGYKANISPKIGLLFMIVYLALILTSGSMAIMKIAKYYSMLEKINP